MYYFRELSTAQTKHSPRRRYTPAPHSPGPEYILKRLSKDFAGRMRTTKKLLPLLIFDIHRQAVEGRMAIVFLCFPNPIHMLPRLHFARLQIML